MQARRPNYPVALAAGALILLAACGGKVEGDEPSEEMGGSGGDTNVPMPTGAGAGGSYDPTPGGSGGSYDPSPTGTGGTTYEPQPTGAGAGGSYEPETGGSGGYDIDAGMPSGVSDGGVYEPEGPMTDPCVLSCIDQHPEGWVSFLDHMSPCVCDHGCEDLCETSVCAEVLDYDVTEPCGSCLFDTAQTECMTALSECIGDSPCQSYISCLLACE
jgi:hypothetical protein